jgi:hypothetical protein
MAATSSTLLPSSSDSRDTRSKRPAKADLRRAPAEQRQRAADHHAQEQQDEAAARRVGGKGMHRSARPSARGRCPAGSENAVIASSTVQALKAPRFSATASEWISAVPTSQGMKEAFSTGSQNHQPPQPSS